MPNNDKHRQKQSFNDFLLHLHPNTIPEETLRINLSWGLGGMALTLVGVLFISGILQLFAYSPHIDSAYNDVINMYREGSFSGLIRNIHFWSGNLLVIIVFLHFLRVFYTGAYDHKRRLNWLIGLCIFIIVLFSNFTGYLLPWDQLAFWAVTIFTNMLGYIPGIGSYLIELLRGGLDVGQTTLANFFVLHVALLPFFLVSLLIWHIWLVRKAKGLILQNKQIDKPKRINTAPHLIIREVAVALSLVAILSLFSIFINAPLDSPANPGMSPNPAKGAWYFLGLQELLLHFHPLFAICIIPFILALCLILIPFVKFSLLPGGVWFGGKRGKKLFCISLVTGIISTAFLVTTDELFFRSNEVGNTNIDIYTRGILPVVFMFVFFLFSHLFLVKYSKYSPAEATMGIFTWFTASMITLTAIGIWFRGAGMLLIMPFGLSL